MKAETFLENLAHPPRRLPELQRRHACCAMKGTDEIGEVIEADVIGDVGHRLVVVGEVARGAAQPRAHQILMRGDAEHGREQAQEMERADAGLARGIFELDLAMRMGVDPERGLDRTAAIPRRDPGLLAGLARHYLDQALRQEMSDLVEADVASSRSEERRV